MKQSSIIVICERKIAYRSPDYLVPWGTRIDSSQNKRFNEKLYKLFKNKTLRILDLGCAGGGFVKTCIDDGHLAVGLEGSDYSKIYKRAEWATIPDFLFTCDITRDFDVFIKSNKGRTRIFFDVITAWEFVEHIAEVDLPRVASNIKKHLAPWGLCIMSISPNEEIIDGVKLHQTIHKKAWWIKKFKELGFTHLEEYVRYFNTQFVRGPKYSAPGSFHLILSLDRSRAPPMPKEKLGERLLDLWIGTRPQRIIKKLLIGE